MRRGRGEGGGYQVGAQRDGTPGPAGRDLPGVSRVHEGKRGLEGMDKEESKRKVLNERLANKSSRREWKRWSKPGARSGVFETKTKRNNEKRTALNL